MNERNFEQAVKLCDCLGTLNLGSGRDLRKELCLDCSFSLWDVTAPFLVLYRFPQLFFIKAPASAHCLRPLRGRLSRLREVVLSPRKSDAGCRDWPEGTKTILFLGFTKTFYRDVLRPVAERLVADEGYEAVVLGETAASPERMLGDGSIKFQSLWEHWNRAAKSEHRTSLQKLSAARTPISAKIRSSEFGRELPAGVNRKALARELAWLFIREFPRMIFYHVVTKHILEKHRPVLVVSADDADQRCRVFSLAARTANIPTFLIQQGLSRRTYPEWRYFSHDKVAAMSESSRTDMINQGIPPEKIVVTGNPGFDRLLAVDAKEDERTRTAFGLKKEQKMVLFASQPYYADVFSGPSARPEMIKALSKAILECPDVVLVVKPHPGERDRKLKSFFVASPKILFAGRTTDITNLIQACDVFVTFFSTSATQALAAGKPVITLDFPGCGGTDLFTRSGATWVARSERDIAAHLDRLITRHIDEQTEVRKNARIKFLNAVSGVPDGKATGRASQAILELIRTN